MYEINEVMIFCIVTGPKDMPRLGSPAVDLDMVLLRYYLRTSQITTAEDLFLDAFGYDETTALQMVTLHLRMRLNPRTRRSVPEVRQEWLRVTAPGFTGTPSRWYRDLQSAVWSVYMAWRAYAMPNAPRTTVNVSLSQSLSRAQRRMLGIKGVVKVELPTVQSQATDAACVLGDRLAKEDAVVWLDNWYFERYSPDPEHPVRSLNVTAFGILFLHSTQDGPAGRTRSHTYGTFPGHPTLATVVNMLP